MEITEVSEGTNGFFVAMPSRKMSDHCEKCGGKNHLRARFCNNCGTNLSENRAKKDFKGRMKLHTDIAHPINAECRKRIQQKVISAFEEEVEKVISAFEEEVEKSKQPGYRPVEMDEPYDDVPQVAT